MAITTLPYPNMDFVPLDVLTATELDQLVANIEAINNANITTSAIANRAITPAKIDASAFGHFARDNDGGSQTFTANNHIVALYPNQLVQEVGCSYSSGTFTISQAGYWIITRRRTCFVRRIGRNCSAIAQRLVCFSREYDRIRNKLGQYDRQCFVVVGRAFERRRHDCDGHSDGGQPHEHHRQTATHGRLLRSR